MTDDEIFEAYASLWTRLQAERDLVVIYEGCGPRGESGWFEINENGCKVISVVRPYYVTPVNKPSRNRIGGAPYPPPDIEDELFTLAHEAGHAESYERGRPVYDAAVLVFNDAARPPMSDVQQDAIMAEEKLAWELGRELVPAELVAGYDVCAAKSLAIYEEILGMPRPAERAC